jgi:hypothetical protein
VLPPGSFSRGMVLKRHASAPVLASKATMKLPPLLRPVVLAITLPLATVTPPVRLKPFVRSATSLSQTTRPVLA